MERPAAVTVLGILNIVFAGFGMVGIAMSSLFLTVMPAANNPALKAMQESPGYAAWMKVSIPLGLLACAVKLTAGIGLLQLKPWGRTLTIGYAIYALVAVVVSQVVNYFVLVRPLVEEVGRHQGPEAAGLIGGVVGGVIAGFVGMIYPILLLYFMTRPNIRAAFRPRPEPPVLEEWRPQ